MTTEQLPKPVRTKSKRPFPLHMTSFENYMFIDDTPRYPMTFIVQLELSGNLNRQAFENAIDVALDRHPLLRAVIGPGKQNRDCWLTAGNRKPYIHFAGPDQPIVFPNGEFINLREEVGFRIWVRHDESRAVVTAQFHHSACDGIGSYHFLGDVLYSYAEQTGDGSLPAQSSIDPKRLRDRGKASYDPNNFLQADGKYKRTWDEALKIILRRSTVLQPRVRKPKSFRAEFPGICSHTFDKNEYRDLRHAAQQRGQIINDMLVETLFVTLNEWRMKNRRMLTGRKLCVMMPLNLRETTDNDIPACNIVAHHFIRRTPAEIRDTNEFRKGIANELLRVKHERHKVRFMHMLAGAHYFYPRTLRGSLYLNRSMATAILSNTGDPTRQFYDELPREGGRLRCGSLWLEDVSGVPPMRPGTRATISIFTYRRVLKICLRCDPNKFSPEETKELLDLYVANLSC